MVPLFQVMNDGGLHLMIRAWQLNQCPALAPSQKLTHASKKKKVFKLYVIPLVNWFSFLSHY